MSEDFRQERRWKRSLAYTTGLSVLEYHRMKKNGLIPKRHSDAVAKIPKMIPEDSVLDKPSTLNIIEDVDPNRDSQIVLHETIQPPQPSFVLNLLTSTYISNTTFEHLQTLEPPAASPGDMYKDGSLIVPVSKFMSDLFKVPGEQKEEGVERLSGMEVYEKSDGEPCGLFGVEEEVRIKELYGPPAKIDGVSVVGAAWGCDEEDALWQYVEVYSGNWALVSSSLTSLRLGPRRELWPCYDKYIELANASFQPHGRGDYLWIGGHLNKKDKKGKVLGLLSTFNFILGLSKRREMKGFEVVDVGKSNRLVNLNSHDTHRAAQIQAGIDVNAPPLRPLELTRLKEQREKILEQTRQTQFLNLRPVRS